MISTTTRTSCTLSKPLKQGKKKNLNLQMISVGSLTILGYCIISHIYTYMYIPAASWCCVKITVYRYRYTVYNTTNLQTNNVDLSKLNKISRFNRIYSFYYTGASFYYTPSIVSLF